MNDKKTDTNDKATVPNVPPTPKETKPEPKPVQVSVQKPEEATVLPAPSAPKKVDRKKVVLSDTVVNSLSVSRNAVLVEKGEVESVVEVDGKQVVVGNEEVSEAEEA